MLHSTDNQPVLLEEGKAFSECLLWELQRDFFLREGVDAWDDQVPFYVTCNPSIANGQANLLLRFMQDWCRRPDYRADEPFYILELGAGSGRFGFYALKRLLAMREQLGLQAVRFVYVLTDLVEADIDYCSQHRAWQPYIEQGLVDFACFDVERDRQITLRQAGTTLGVGEGATPSANPCLVIANYVFDSLRHDIFYTHKGELYTALVNLSTHRANLSDQQDRPRVKQLDQVRVDFSYRKTSADYYHVDRFDHVLAAYAETFGARPEDTYFTLPIGALRCLENIQALCRGNYLLLAADNGHSELWQLARLFAPQISWHGSFSLAVNFHALAQYLRAGGGDSLLSPPQKGIASVALLANGEFSTLPETRFAADDYLKRYSPATLFSLYREIRDNLQHCSPDTCIALLTLTDWDAHIFNKLASHLMENLSDLSETTLQALLQGMPRIAENFYYMPGATDTLSLIAWFFQELEYYQQALDYYRQSLSYYGEADHICYNQGLCHYYLGEDEKASAQFKRALQLNSDLACARECLQTLAAVAG